MRWRNAVTYCLLSLFVAFVQSVHAQSWPQHTLWSQTPLQLNPAASGKLYSLDASINYRAQWVGLEGAPQTTQVSIGAPIYYIGAGAMLGLEYEEVGAHTLTIAKGAFAYNLIDREGLSLTVGAGASYRSLQVNGGDLRTSTGTYDEIPFRHNDDRLGAAVTQNASGIGVDIGVEVSIKETIIGLSVIDANESVTSWSGIDRVWPRTIVAYGKSILPVAEAIDLEVSALAQSVITATQVQIGVMGWYDNNIGLGTSFRAYSGSTLDAVSLLLGWRPSQTITVAYSYDYGLSTLQRAHEGSHEVILRYIMSKPIGKGQLPPIIFHPRQ